LSMITQNRPHRRKTPFQMFLSFIRYCLHKVEDWLSHLFWLIFDSWRKPDLEIIVKAPPRRCLQALAFSCNERPVYPGLQAPIAGAFGTRYFELYRSKSTPFFVRDGGIRPGLSGKLIPTSRGTCIRAWCRFMVVGTVFLTIWFGTVLGSLAIYALYSFVQARYSSPELNQLVIASGIVIFPISYLGNMVLVTSIGAAISRSGSPDILEFVKNVLINCGSNRQFLMGRQLKRSVLSK
jgi:hypothetical protein